MFRVPAIAFLLALICFQFGFKSVIVVNWSINRARITEKYCVNKDKPAMQCNGRCYLAKQLRSAELKNKRLEAGEQSRNDLPLQKAASVENLTYLPSSFTVTIPFMPLSKKIFINGSTPSVSNAYCSGVFHPPSC